MAWEDYRKNSARLILFVIMNGYSRRTRDEHVSLASVSFTMVQTSGCLISCTYDWPSGKESVKLCLQPRPICDYIEYCITEYLNYSKITCI